MLTFAWVTIMDKPVFEKNLSVPKAKGRQSRFRWLAEMEVGDSFTCSHEDCQNIRQLVYLRRENKMAKWLPGGFRITGRKSEDGLYRVWRVA